MRLFVIMSLALLLFAGQTNAQAKKELKTRMDSVSYAIGCNIGNSFKTQQIPVDVDLLAQAIKDVIAGKNVKMPDDKIQACLQSFQQEMSAKMQEKMKRESDKNDIEAQAFLTENKKKEGVKVTESGLQYKIVKEGTGEIPKSTDKVTVHYVGKLLDGKEFDSSIKRGQPATFPVTGVIPGWTEALQLMKVGSKWNLWIPSKLGYGERGAGNDIPPGSTLFFEVELLGIDKTADKADDKK
jgi:FKBP-type peptidyl-prolyl cis-trans isomerase FklB